MRKLFLIIASVCLTSALFAQSNQSSSGSDQYKGWSAFLNLGTTNPFTDLNRFQYFPTLKDKNENRPAFALGARKMFSSVFGLQADFSAGHILGDFRSKGLLGSGLSSTSGNSEYDAYQQAVSMLLWGQPKPKQSVYFKTPFYQVSTSVYIDLNNLGVSLFNARKGFLAKRKVVMYTYAGLGFIHFNSKIYTLKSDSAFKTYLAGVSGKTTEAVIPVGLGVKYKINNQFNIGLEYRLNNVLSDKLDALVMNGTGVYLRQGSYDKYGMTSVALTYNFLCGNKSAENIEWVTPLDKADPKIPTAAELLADADGDGVADALDKEANTPAGCRVDGSGRALDTDGDGVIDCKDRERLSPAGYPVDANGVAQIPDTDGDGVLDNVDWEVNSPAGCKVDAHGVCPKEEKPVWGGAYNLPTIYFDTDKSLMKSSYMVELQRTALLMYANPTMKLDIVGNTDKHHTDDYNDKLGMRRAKAVADILIQRFNVPAERVNVKTNGKHILKSPNDELNRRVDIIPAQ